LAARFSRQIAAVPLLAAARFPLLEAVGKEYRAWLNRPCQKYGDERNPNRSASGRHLASEDFTEMNTLPDLITNDTVFQHPKFQFCIFGA
jgi:hypothetical protein